MILTTTLITNTIIKAYCILASKTIKYYGGLAIGKKYDNLFKQIRLLKSYINILKKFKIIDSITPCNCCIAGDYKVLLNTFSLVTLADIQFNSNGTGLMFFDNINYPFTYGSNCDNTDLVIRFDDLYDQLDVNTILALSDITTDSECNFTPVTVSPIEVATVIVTGTPIIVNYETLNWDGSLKITEDNGLIDIVQLTIPSSTLNNPVSILEQWNTLYHPTNNGWLLNYNELNSEYTMLSPFDGINYASIDSEFVFEPIFVKRYNVEYIWNKTSENF